MNKYFSFCLMDEIDKYPGKPIVSPQCYQILVWLEDHEYITPMDAMNELGIMRLAARIFEIRSKLGIDIEGDMVSGTNRFGFPIHYKRYKKVA